MGYSLRSAPNAEKAILRSTLSGPISAPVIQRHRAANPERYGSVSAKAGKRGVRRPCLYNKVYSDRVSLEHILLGLLRQPASGYDLKAVLDHGIGHFWGAELSQIYPSLRRLEKRGLLGP